MTVRGLSLGIRFRRIQGVEITGLSTCVPVLRAKVEVLCGVGATGFRGGIWGLRICGIAITAATWNLTFRKKCYHYAAAYYTTGVSAALVVVCFFALRVVRSFSLPQR